MFLSLAEMYPSSFRGFYGSVRTYPMQIASLTQEPFCPIWALSYSIYSRTCRERFIILSKEIKYSCCEQLYDSLHIRTNELILRQEFQPPKDQVLEDNRTTETSREEKQTEKCEQKGLLRIEFQRRRQISSVCSKQTQKIPKYFQRQQKFQEKCKQYVTTYFIIEMFQFRIVQHQNFIKLKQNFQ